MSDRALSDDKTPTPSREKAKASYVGAPAIFALERECQLLWAAFCDPDDSYSGIYLVGSALEKPEWRDVDVRLMMGDEFFARLFPDALLHSAAWEKDPRWLVMTTSIASHLRAATGLPVDFQFQPTKFANERHGGRPRLSLGAISKPQRQFTPRQGG